MVTDPQTNLQTGPIAIHCAAKLSTQCNEGSKIRLNGSRSYVAIVFNNFVSVLSEPG